MRVYLDRFLNVPAARLPDERSFGVDGHAAASELLDLMDREQQVTPVAEVVDALIAIAES